VANKTKKKPDLNLPAKTILSTLLAEFREKGFGTAELRDSYKGLAPTELRSICCSDGTISTVDFDLAMSDLDECELVKTGPMTMYENEPGSSVTVLAFFSKNEFSYLTEEGYKAATRIGASSPPRIPTPRVHISGGTFNQSPIGVGAHVSQTMSVEEQHQNIIAGNWEHLAKVLNTAGISHPELDELSAAVKEDGKTIGAKVKSWIEKTAPKVLSGGVKIGATVGQSLLLEYLRQYYGLG